MNAYDSSNSGNTAEASIPKTVFQTSLKKPDQYLLDEMRQRLGVDWEYRHFTDADILAFFKQNSTLEFPRITEKFLQMPTGAHKADLFRYYFLYVHGGVFVDSDAMLKSSLDPIIQGVDFFTVRSGYIPRTVFQGFIGCTPHNALMHRALQDAYSIDTRELKRNYYLLCANMYEFIEKYSDGQRVRLLEEVMYDNGLSEILDEDNRIVLLHFFAAKVAPRPFRDSRILSRRATASLGAEPQSEAEDIIRRLFALARAGNLPPDIYATFLSKIEESGNTALLEAFVEVGCADARAGESTVRSSAGSWAPKMAKINTSLADRFTKVFTENQWGDSESVSGPGSRRNSVIVKVSLLALRQVVESYNIKSINDIPCGDFNWIALFLEDNKHIDYAGFDIVASLIARNQALYQQYNFRRFDITSDVPPYADLILCKDLFLHLTYEDILKSLLNMKRSGAKYLLASSHFGVENTELQRNIAGSARPLNVCAQPINLPEPMRQWRWSDAFLGLWKFSDICEGPDSLKMRKALAKAA